MNQHISADLGPLDIAFNHRTVIRSTPTISADPRMLEWSKTPEDHQAVRCHDVGTELTGEDVICTAWVPQKRLLPPVITAC